MQSLKNILVLIATFFNVGKVPKAPGTFGTLAAIPLALILSKFGPFIYMIFVALLLPIGILAAETYEQAHKGHDHQEIVIDEVLGFLIAMTWLPMTWQAYLAGFLLFRVLDILKPFPIGYLDKKIPGGVGVVVDDVVAGVIANIILQTIYVKTSWLGAQIIITN